jgi:hypothetical protein
MAENLILSDINWDENFNLVEIQPRLIFFHVIVKFILYYLRAPV